MKRMFYRLRAAIIAVLIVAVPAPFLVFADVEPEPAIVEDEPYDFDMDAPWLYYDMTEEEYYEEFEPWRATGRTEEEYWDGYLKTLDENMRVESLTEFGFTDTDAPNVAVNGRALNFTGAKPFARGGATMVPARATFEALGADVSYDAKSKTMTVVLGDAGAEFTMGAASARVTGPGRAEEIELPAAPFIDGATASAYVPLRALAEGFGFDVYWDDYFKVAEVVEKGALIDEIDKDFTVFNALIRNLAEKSADRFASGAADKSDVNFSFEADARYNADPYYAEDEDVSEGGAKLTGKFKIISGAGGLDASGDVNFEIDGFDDVLYWIMDDPEIKTILGELKKGVPADVLVNYEDAALYLRVPILAHIYPALDKNAWIAARASDYGIDVDFLAEAVAMEGIFADGEGATIGNLLYMSYFDYSDFAGYASADFRRAKNMLSAGRTLAPFLGDTYMEKSGDAYTVKLGRMELLNVIRRFFAEEGMNIDAEDYSEFLAGVPMANYTLRVIEEDGAPASMELSVNAKVSTDLILFQDDENGYVELHYDVAGGQRNASVDISVSVENAGPIEKGSFRAHVDAVSAPTDETPRAKPPAGARTVPFSEL